MKMEVKIQLTGKRKLASPNKTQIRRQNKTLRQKAHKKNGSKRATINDEEIQ